MAANASTMQRRGALRSSRLAVLAATVAAVYVAFTISAAFVAPGASAAGARQFRTARNAAEASKSTSVALVKVNEENAMTTAGVLGGLVGLWFGGGLLGGALFAAGSYLARKDKKDDIAQAINGISTASLEAVNFAAGLNEDYKISDQLGDAISEALDKAKTDGGEASTAKTIGDLLDGIGEAVESFDKEVGIKESLGTLATVGSELAYEVVDKAVELADEYKVVEQVQEKLGEATKSKAP